MFLFGVLEGVVLKLESLAIRKVNDGDDGVLRRLSSVHVFNGQDQLVASHEGVVEELTDLSPSSWSALAALTNFRGLGKVTTIFFAGSLLKLIAMLPGFLVNLYGFLLCVPRMRIILCRVSRLLVVCLLHRFSGVYPGSCVYSCMKMIDFSIYQLHLTTSF